MLVLNQGKTLTPGDLGLNVRDASGRLIDPAGIAYALFSVGADAVRTLISAPKMLPARCTTGVYFVPGVISSFWEGRYDLIWYLQQFPNEAECQIFEEFEVCRIDPITSSFDAPSVLLTSKPGLSKILVERIMTVRELLGDSSPDRNYHFIPPESGQTVAGFNQRVGFIWTDATIIRMLRLNIQKLNTWNPLGETNYTCESAPKAWGEAMALGAAASCLSKEAAIWTAESFDYSLNGISLSLKKGPEYQSLAQSYLAEFTEWAPLLTANRPASVGLRQQRWII